MNNPLMFTDPSGEAWWHWALGIASFGMVSFDPASVLATITVTMGTAATTAGVTASLAPVTALMFAGTANSIDQAVTYVGSFFNGPQWGGRRFNNSWRMLGGLFQTDENRNFWENVGMLVSRWTWEGIQTWAGYGYSSSRNAFGNVDRVDYLGGATFVTNEDAGYRDGITFGNYININIDDKITGNFDDRVVSDPLFMHEYGHTFDSRIFGVSYLLAIGIPSIISASGNEDHSTYWTERRANRHAKSYFEKHYSVDWNSQYWDRSYKKYRIIENGYPTY